MLEVMRGSGSDSVTGQQEGVGTAAKLGAAVPGPDTVKSRGQAHRKWPTAQTEAGLGLDGDTRTGRVPLGGGAQGN